MYLSRQELMAHWTIQPTADPAFRHTLLMRGLLLSTDLKYTPNAIRSARRRVAATCLCNAYSFASCQHCCAIIEPQARKLAATRYGPPTPVSYLAVRPACHSHQMKKRKDLGSLNTFYADFSMSRFRPPSVFLFDFTRTITVFNADFAPCISILPLIAQARATYFYYAT